MVRIIPILLAFVMAAVCSCQEEEKGSKNTVVRMKVPEDKSTHHTEETGTTVKPEPKVELVRAPSKAIQTPAVSPPNSAQPEPLREGYCRVRKGDSLYTISGREDVYGDPLKWLSLFRLNREVLNVPRHDILHRELPQDLELRFVTPSEAMRNRKKFGENSWVVNVLSLETPEQLVPYSIALIREGYSAYMTKATVKGKEWFRLRVGFFKDRASALSAGEEIMKKLDIQDSWVANAPEELRDYGGYAG